jgi:hypothetical protein
LHSIASKNDQRCKYIVWERIGYSLPAHGEAPGGIEETGRVCREGTSNWEEYSQLTESLHRAEHEDTDDAECNNQRGRTARGESLARCDEETSTWDELEFLHK